MVTLMTTRFDKRTWEENLAYKTKNNITGCIYCSPQPMSPKILTDSLLFVIEMNNSLNRIEGIGIIKNTIRLDKYFRVYETGDFNRYVFKGDYRLDREELIMYNNKVVEILDNILFKGKTHLKRGRAITKVSDEFLKMDNKCQGLNITNIIKEQFLTRFRPKNIINLLHSNRTRMLIIEEDDDE